jgi:large subunit ribosomal protein L22
MAEVTAKLMYARISPQKCRLVADSVRGASAGRALSTLKFMPKKGAKIVYKVLWSAVENARENAGLDVDDLKVSRIYVDEAPQLKRFAARAKGRGTRIVKRNSHITVAVSDGKKD